MGAEGLNQFIIYSNKEKEYYAKEPRIDRILTIHAEISDWKTVIDYQWKW